LSVNIFVRSFTVHFLLCVYDRKISWLVWCNFVYTSLSVDVTQPTWWFDRFLNLIHLSWVAIFTFLWTISMSTRWRKAYSSNWRTTVFNVTPTLWVATIIHTASLLSCWLWTHNLLWYTYQMILPIFFPWLSEHLKVWSRTSWFLTLVNVWILTFPWQNSIIWLLVITLVHLINQLNSSTWSFIPSSTIHTTCITLLVHLWSKGCRTGIISS
jgi:hypothetical protein